MLTISQLDARAVRASVAVVSRVGLDDLGRATPCAEWTLGDLLAHMTVQHDGFAAAASGGGADRSVWRVRPLSDDPVSAYAAAADRVIAAFAEEGVLEREFSLPEISTSLRFPGAQAISFHFIDYVVHGWDVARSLGVGYGLDPDLAEPALRVAQAVPGGQSRLAPGAAFRPSLEVPSDGTVLDRILTTLGRSPTWPD